MGSRILQSWDSRPKLPLQKPDEPYPLWRLLRNLVGQDLTRVSLPCGMNEPLAHGQKFCERTHIANAVMIRASNCNDPAKRCAIIGIALHAFLYIFKQRKKKFFNAMLGETHEMVTDTYRMVSEKVSHTPEQIVCAHFESDLYIIEYYDKPNVKFTFGGGRGQVDCVPYGQTDIYMKKHDEHISATFPVVNAKNVMFGGLYLDFSSTCKTYNHTTGDFAEMEFRNRKGK